MDVYGLFQGVYHLSPGLGELIGGLVAVTSKNDYAWRIGHLWSNGQRHGAQLFL